MRLLLVRAAGLLALLAVAALAWVRLAPDHPADWHVDPLTAAPVSVSNAWRVAPEATAGADAAAPVFPVPAAELAAALDAVAMAEPATERLAGGPGALFTTYIQRSRWIGFPDYISVRAIPLDAGRSTLAVLSRARYGKSDMGVNRARVERWLAALAPLKE